MASIDPRNAGARKVISSFNGISDNTGLSADSASELRNFRILPDGTLEKRNGYRTFLNLPSPLRGQWEGTVNGKSYFFAVTGTGVYMIPPGGEEATNIYTLTTDTGEVFFAFYAERLYLTDGASLLVFRPAQSTFSTADGYTPLYGKNWHPTQMGDVYEPRNLIQNRIRIHYLNTNGSAEFHMPYTMKAVNRVKVNGNYIYNFNFTPGSATFRIPESLASVGGTVEIAATLEDIYDRRSAVLRASRTAVYLDTHHETFFCTGGAPGYTVYRSAHVTNSMLADSSSQFSSTDPLYLPENSQMTVGSIQHPVTALCQCGEQMLVMNDLCLWAIRHTDDESDSTQIFLLRDGIGCCSPGAVLLCGGDPVTLQENGLCKLHFSMTDPDAFTSEIISGDLPTRFTPAYLRGGMLLWDAVAGELWLRSSADKEELVWLFSPEKKRWICYDDIPATRLFTYRGAVAFGMPDGRLCVMTLGVHDDDGEAFSASYQSHFFCLTDPEPRRRVLCAALCFTAGGGTVGLQLETDRHTRNEYFAATGSVSPELVEARTSPGRFRFLRYRISAAGAFPCKIHLLALSANN